MGDYLPALPVCRYCSGDVEPGAVPGHTPTLALGDLIELAAETLDKGYRLLGAAVCGAQGRALGEGEAALKPVEEAADALRTAWFFPVSSHLSLQ